MVCSRYCNAWIPLSLTVSIPVLEDWCECNVFKKYIFVLLWFTLDVAHYFRCCIFHHAPWTVHGIYSTHHNFLKPKKYVGVALLGMAVPLVVQPLYGLTTSGARLFLGRTEFEFYLFFMNFFFHVYIQHLHCVIFFMFYIWSWCNLFVYLAKTSIETSWAFNAWAGTWSGLYLHYLIFLCFIYVPNVFYMFIL